MYDIDVKTEIGVVLSIYRKDEFVEAILKVNC